MMLKAVTREQTLTERAQHQFEELIVSGKLMPGDRLPSENEMGKMLGVSRTVVREAVRLLSARGLVEARSGSGVYVRELNSAMIREPIDLLLRCRAIKVEDILEVRALMEVHLAGLAAERASSEEIVAMEQAIGASRRRTHVAKGVEHDEGIVMLERAPGPRARAAVRSAQP